MGDRVTTALTARADLASSIATAIAAADWPSGSTPPVVYDHPAESITLPAVVIVPDEPYWTPHRFTASAPAVKVNFQIQILVKRTELSVTLELLEQIASVVALALLTAPVFRWSDLGQPQTVDVGDIPVLMAPIACHGLM